MNHSFNTTVAELYGLTEAIILENIYFWCKKNEANKKLMNGEPWTYNSVKAFNEIFSYLSPSSISRALKNLETKGLVKIGCFNSNSYDRTKWYCITEKTKEFYEPKKEIVKEEPAKQDSTICQNEKSICQNEKWNNQNEKSISENDESNSQKTKMNITDINTDNKPDVNTDILYCTEGAKEKTIKKQSVSFPKSYYDQIYEMYLTNYKSLYPDRELPVINYRFQNRDIKKAFILYGFEKVLEAVKNSVNHKFLVEHNYPISFIFGEKELPLLINKNYTQQSNSSGNYKNFDKSSLDGKDFFAN